MYFILLLVWVYVFKILDFGGVIYFFVMFVFFFGCVVVEIEYGIVVIGMKGDLVYVY